MKKYHSYIFWGFFYILTLLLTTTLPSCLGRVSDRIERRISKNRDQGILISQPRKKSIQSKDTVIIQEQKSATYKDANGVEQTILMTTRDDKTGEDIRTVEMSGLTVIAKSKQIAERNGKVTIDFTVNVPSTMIDSKWQLQLTPMIYILEDSMSLEKLLLSGADYLKKQKGGLIKYQNYLNSIVPDSLYLDEFFNEEGYLGALAKLDREYYRMYRDGVLEKNLFIDWKNRINQRYLYYNGKMYTNRESIQGSHSWKYILPSHWMERKLDKDIIPSRWLIYEDSQKELNKRELTREDSIHIAKRYFDFKARAENERKKEMREDMFRKLVRFPLQRCRLDTIMFKGDHFEYLYRQELDANEDFRKISLTLNGIAVGVDESVYKLPSTDTLTYYISSIAQFADMSTHYRLEVVSRKAQTNMKAYLNFKVGKSEFDIDYADNRKEIGRVMDAIYKLTFSGELVMDSINMIATASPEGLEERNLFLSRQRSIQVKEYLASRSDDKQFVSMLKPRAIGEDWQTLKELILESDTLNNRDDILMIISSRNSPDAKEKMMRSYSHDYSIITDSFYPKMRAVNMEFHMHRRDMIKDTIHTTVIDEQYMKALECMKNRKYKDALFILEEYSDYNTAVCLMSLGYDRRALDILLKERESANQQYLLALIYSRLNKDEKAVSCFMRSTQLDQGKIYRGILDPEVNRLIETYNLKFDNDYE